MYIRVLCFSSLFYGAACHLRLPDVEGVGNAALIYGSSAGYQRGGIVVSGIYVMFFSGLRLRIIISIHIFVLVR